MKIKMNNMRNNKPLLNNYFSRAFLLILVLSITFQNYGIAQMPKENDRIGWSSDGNLADEDDWAATPMALAIFAKMGWQDKLVHFDYNNRLDRSLEWKEAENFESTIGGAKKFGFNQDVFFDDQRELEAAIEHAKEEINKSHEGSKFWYVQAGPFEVAYQALLRSEPEKRQYCILVSHSEVNEKADKWKLEDGSPSHGKDDCVALGAKYFFTTNQYKEKFGGKRYKRWDLAMIGSEANIADPGVNGLGMLAAYKITGDEKYMKAAQALYDFLMPPSSRNSKGNIYHNTTRPVIFSDNMFMVAPFIAQMGNLDEAMFQIEAIRCVLWNEEEKLFHHIRIEETDQWRHKYFWGGGVGWCAAAMSTVADLMPDDRQEDKEKLNN